MNKLLIASTMAAALTFSISSQAGVYDYSRTIIDQGELIHKSSGSSMTKKSSINVDEKNMTAENLWQWDDVIYK